MHFGLEGYIPLVLYFGGIGVFFASVFWRPEIGIYFIVPLFPLQTVRYKVHQYPLGNKLIDIVLLGVFLGIVFRPKFKLFTRNPFNVLLVVYIIFTYLSLWQGWLFLGGEMPLSISNIRFSGWKNYMVMPVAFFLVLGAIRDTKQIRTLLVLMAGGAFYAARSLDRTVGGRDLSHFSYAMRDGGVFGYAGANGAGAFLGICAIVLLAVYAAQERRRYRWAVLALAGFLTYCLMLTFSRGAYIGFLAAVVFWGIIKERKIFLVLIPFLLVWELVVPAAVTERVNMTYDSSGQLEVSAADRVTLWEDAMVLIPRSPLLGTGIATYAFMHRVGKYADTHNFYLKVLVETGIIGSLLFLWILFLMWYTGMKLFWRAKDPLLKCLGVGVAAAVICCLANNLFGDRWTYIEMVGYLWVLAALSIRGLILTAETKATEPLLATTATDDPAVMPCESYS